MNSKIRPKGFWTRERCLSEIERLHLQGFDLSVTNVNRQYGSLYTKTLQLVGSWEYALSLKGIDASKFRRKRGNGYWTKDKIQVEIKMLEAEKHDFSPANMLKSRSDIYRIAIKHFGSWEDALKQCGVEYEKHVRKRRNDYWSEDRVARYIQDLITKGEPLNTRYVETEHYPMYKGAIRVFGSWEKAVTENGLNYEEIRLDNMSQKFYGQQFERIVHDIFKDIGIEYIKSKEVDKGLIPDILLPNGIIYDIKLSNYTDWLGKTTVEKYGRYSNGIGIIFLRGEYEKPEYKLNGVLFRHVSLYVKQLPKYKRRKYTKRLEELLEKSVADKLEYERQAIT